MRRVLSALMLFGIPAALVGQTPDGSWSNLNSLRAGQGIEVIESSMNRHAGEFISVTDELLTLKRVPIFPSNAKLWPASPPLHDPSGSSAS